MAWSAQTWAFDLLQIKHKPIKIQRKLCKTISLKLISGGNMNNGKSTKGFTIIEVVIVLAIAGLIFSIVFWALPNLQKNQRDNQRRNIVGNVVANLDQHAANLNGNYPVDSDDYATFVKTFYECTGDPTINSGTPPASESSDTNSVTAVGCDLKDPIDNLWVYFGDNTGDGADTEIMDNTTATGELYVGMGAKCSDTAPGSVDGGAGARAFAHMIKLENGISFCQDNS
jgi:prepilin-type N-terminal cleavage/methylation domain-containing protein